MIKAIFLSSEKNVINIVKNIVIPSGIELTQIIEVQQENADSILAGYRDAELVISCGLKFALNPFNSQRPQTPYLIDVSFSPIDIVRLSSKSDGMIGLAAPKAMLASVSELPECPKVRIFGFDDDVAEALDAARKSGVSVIAGAQSLEAAAELRGFEFIHAAPGFESVKSAFQTASLEADWLEREKRAALEKEALINVCRSGIISIDGKGKILSLSLRAEYFLDCRDKNVIGAYLLNVFNALDKEILDTAIVKGEHVFNHIIGAGSRRIMVNIDPILSDSGEVVSAIVGIQPWIGSIHQNQLSETGVKYSFANLKSVTDEFKKLINSARSAAYTDVPVLLRGEPGTEITYIARCIHNESPRAKRPFIDVECSIWKEGRIEEFLFGRSDESIGERQSCVLNTANGGTLFFDRIEFLSQDAQFRVFKLIQGTYMPLRAGDEKPDFRIIASTQMDLRKMVHDGEFREDLYYALTVARMEVPSLRDRPDDVKYILDYFITRYCNMYQKPVLFSVGAYNTLTEFSWPGNVQQLDHVVQSMIFSTPRRNIGEAFVRSMLNDIAVYDEAPSVDTAAKRSAILEDEAAEIVEALTRCCGNKQKAAKELGISRTTLWRKMQRCGIVADFSV